MQTPGTQVQAEIREVGPLSEFHRLLAENDALIRGAELGNGRVCLGCGGGNRAFGVCYHGSHA